MKLTRLFISKFRQFDYFELDLRYPATHEKSGLPLDKICLIGKNGTGKSTLLKIINEFYSNPSVISHFFSDENDLTQIGFEVEFNGELYFIGRCVGIDAKDSHGILDYHINHYSFFKVEKMSEYLSKIREVFTNYNLEIYEEINSLTNESNKGKECLEIKRYFQSLRTNTHNSLLVFSPSDSEPNNKSNGTIINSQKYLRSFPYQHEMTYAFLENFWNLIIFQIKKRELDQQNYYKDPENKNKTVSKVDEDFDLIYPEYLDHISKVWNVILGDAGLYFDHQMARLPAQLADNFMAYFKMANSDKQIQYELLSSGLKNLLFRTGYLSCLFYKRNIKHATILIDEPEISLFPDLLIDVIENYTDISSNGQYFFATHSPLVASQFDPSERIILEFNERKFVDNKKGISPEGDDPNDLLINDFGLINVLGKKGKEALEKYIELKTRIYAEENEDMKSVYLKEFLEISNKYNFGG